MAEYRAYIVARDGHLLRFEPHICDDDFEAIVMAKRPLPCLGLSPDAARKVEAALSETDRKRLAAT